MENYVKWCRRLFIGTAIAVVVVICLTMVVLAVPSSVTDFIGTASSTSIYLRWSPATSSTSTVIRYSTTTYPTAVGDGTSAYNGTSTYTTLSSLTAGTTYYFSAWGYDGSDYSASAANLVISTLPSVSANTSVPFSQPTIPASATQDPDTSGWSISPIDDILSYFADPTNAHSGLGMPVNNVVMFMAGMGVTIISIGSYVRWRSFFTSWFIAIVLCGFLCSIEAMQWIVIGYLLLVGAGVWAVEKSTQ